MPSVGSYLRGLRQRRGVSLDEISRSTRIPQRYLEALEGDDFAPLPAPPFTRGFIRAYCQALHEPPDQALPFYHPDRSGRGGPPRPQTPDPGPLEFPSPARTRRAPRHARPRRGDGRRVVVPARGAHIGVDVGASAHGGWTNERREHPGRRDPRVGLEPSVRPQHRERGGRHPRAERPPAAAAGPERSGDRAACRSHGGSVTFLSGLSDRLREGLKRSQEHLASGLAALLQPERPIDDTLYEELEELLLAADLGATLAADFTNRAREEVMFGTVTRADQLRPLFRRFLADTLQPSAQSLNLDHRPATVLMLGGNGAGKTTTAAKLAAALKGSLKHGLLAAGDTFRAAAIEHLQGWSEPIGVQDVHQAPGSDPAAVVFDAVKAATARGVDALIVDTAGRLHTKTNLMEELAKLKRVIERQLPGAPHEALMVMDAPTGQNGVAQARMFHEAIGLSGVALTKLDGTAKGGIVVRIVRELKVPIKLIGVGERVDDLQAFDAEAFVDALLPVK